LAKTVFPKGEIKSYKGGGTLLLDAVKNGQADCLLNDSSAVAGQAAGYPKGTFKVMPGMLAKEALAFATRYDSLDLLTWANLFIDQTTLDGRLESNLDYWVNTTKWKEEH
jgi:polar amino acid transport system substrate-binding protein